MRPSLLKILPLLLLIALLFESGRPALAGAPEPAKRAEGVDRVGLVIVTPPGIDLGKDGARYVAELVALVSEAMGLEPGQLAGSAFGDPVAAAEAIAARPDCFVLASLGFYAAHRSALGLSPLLALRRTDGEPERYRIVVKKGRFETLAALQGHTLAGSPLHESERFIDEAVFGGALRAKAHFQLKPTKRPLREVRALLSDKVDAVLIDAAQFASLRALPLFEALAVLHTSEPLPSLGLMARGGTRMRALSPKMIEAASALCDREEGRAICQSFGIAGFEKADLAAIDDFAAKIGP